MAKEVNKRINIWINGKEVENNIKSIRGAMAQLTNQLNKMEIGSNEYIETSKKLKQLKEIYDNHCNSLKQTSSELDNLTKKKSDYILLAGAASAAISTSISAIQKFVSATQEYVDAYATIDDAMSGVQKTTGMTREEVELLNAELGKIDTRTSREELLTIAQIGGRMGLAKEQILDFTKSVDLANVALGDSFAGGAEEISAVLGKISLAFKETRDGNIGDSLSRIGSAINEVGASANATEPNIAAFVQRVGSMPEAFRPSVQEAIALGAAFEESSIDAEVASRAFGIVMNKATTNIEGFASIMKQPVEAVRELINTNPTKFFTEFSRSLNGMNAEQIGNTLKDLKLNADGVVKIVGAMSGSADRFNEILATSNAAFAENTSLMNEFNTVNNNSAAQLEKAKNAVMDAKAALGEELMPVITKITNMTASGMQVVQNVAKFMLQHKTLCISLAAAYTTLWAIKNKNLIVDKATVVLTKTKAVLMGTYKTVVLGVAFAKNTLTNNTMRAAAAQKMLKAAFASTPWGAILTAVTALGIGIYKLVKRESEATKMSKELKQSISDMTSKNVANIENLSRKWSMLGDTMEDKKKFINDNKKAFEELGVSINTVEEAENLLINNKDRFVQSLYDRAYAAAMMKQAEEMIASNSEYTMNDAMQAKVLREKADEIQKELDSMKGSEYDTAAAWAEKSALVEEKMKYESMANSYQRKVDDVNKKALELMKIADDYQRTADEINKSTGINLNNNTGNEIGEEVNSVTGESASEKFNKEKKKFEEKLQEFRNKQRIDQLNDWEKTKVQIVAQYDEMIAEAEKYYGKESQLAKDLEQEKGDAVIAAGKKYLKQYGDAINDFVEKTAEMSGKLDGEDGSALMNDILGSNKKWDEHIASIVSNIETLQNVVSSMGENDEDRPMFESQILAMQNALSDAQIKKLESTAAIIRKYAGETNKFIASEQKRLSDSTKSEYQKEIEAIEERYNAEISAIKELIEARKKLLGNDGAGDAEIEYMNQQIEAIEGMKEKAKKAVSDNSENTWINQLMDFDWKNFNKDWKQGLNVAAGALQEFGSAAMNIIGSINDIQSNREQQELNDFKAAQDAKAEALQERLDAGLISQEQYDESIEQLNAETEAKEKEIELEQFRREKRMAIVNAIIAGAVAIMQGFAQAGPIGGAILAALQAAMTAAQIAVISSQPEPYAKGGYIERKKFIMAGEAGREWIASNQLLSDPATAPIIEALQQYQDGKRMALRGVSVPSASVESMYQSGKNNSRTFASSNSDNELLNEMKKMNKYLMDPKNRQAVIIRKLQLEYDKNESEIKQLARL